MDDAQAVGARPQADFLVVRVWFEGPDRCQSFRARVMKGAAGTSSVVATPGAVVAIVEAWLAHLVEDRPPVP